MGKIRRRPPPSQLVGEQLRVFEAIAAGAVVRDDCNGEHRGMWARYVLDGAEVGMTVRALRSYGLVDAPLLGAPQLTADGWARTAAPRRFRHGSGGPPQQPPAPDV